MDTLFVVMAGIVAAVVVVGALIGHKKEDPLRVARIRREDNHRARPVFLSHDQHWRPPSSEVSVKSAEESPETAVEETIAAS